MLAGVVRLTHPKWNKSYTPSAYIRTGLPSGGGLVFHHLSTPSSSPLPSIARCTKPRISSRLNSTGLEYIFVGPMALIDDFVESGMVWLFLGGESASDSCTGTSDGRVSRSPAPKPVPVPVPVEAKASADAGKVVEVGMAGGVAASWRFAREALGVGSRPYGESEACGWVVEEAAVGELG